MKIDNPPSPPFRKGGMGGFGSYFPCNSNHQSTKFKTLCVFGI
jgi:hypothetical protein